MKRGAWVFTMLALAVAGGLALFASPFASSSPDGLERIAQDHGFAEKGETATVWRHSPFADYMIPGLGNGPLATGAAGLAGTLAVFTCGIALSRLLPSRRHKERERGE